MEFHECLNELLTKYDVKAADIHKITDLKRPYISKMLSGDLLPSSYDIVQKVMDTMDLTLDEKIALTDSYLTSRSVGESKRMWEAFKQVYFLQYPKLDKIKTEGPCGLSNAELVGGEKLLGAICSMMKNSKSEPMLFFSPLTLDSAERMSKAFSQLPKDNGINWIMPFGKPDASDAQNFSLWSNCLTVAAVRSCTVMKSYSDIASLLKSMPFPFYLISDDSLILFDSELEHGQFYSDGNIAQIYRKTFAEIAQSSELLMMSFDEASSVLKLLSTKLPNMLGDKNDCYTLVNIPCILFDISKTDIRDNTIENNGSHEFADMYIQFLKHVISNIDNFYDIFSIYGMQDFLDDEIWYELGKHFSKNISKYFRRQALRASIIDTISVPNFESLGLRLPGFNKQPFIGMNMFSNGCIIGIYDFEEKPLVVVAADKSVTDSAISFLRELKKHHLIATKEETSEYIRKELDKRQAEEME